jgi:hypothetical protein
MQGLNAINRGLGGEVIVCSLPGGYHTNRALAVERVRQWTDREIAIAGNDILQAVNQSIQNLSDRRQFVAMYPWFQKSLTSPASEKEVWWGIDLRTALYWIGEQMHNGRAALEFSRMSEPQRWLWLFRNIHDATTAIERWRISVSMPAPNKDELQNQIARLGRNLVRMRASRIRTG